MSIEIVGFRASDRLPSGSLLRLTFDSHWYDTFSVFPDAARDLYQKLYPLARVIPTTPLVVLNESKTAIIDANTKDEMLGADLVNKLDNASERFAFVSRVELLSGDDRSVSSGATGADQRNDLQKKTDEQKDKDSAFNKLWEMLGTAGTVVKWLVIAAVIIGLLIFASQLQSVARRPLRG